MLTVPKLSAPLVKDIRTGEGVFEWVLAAADAAATLCGDLSFSKGGTFLAILAGIKGARRGLLKLVAVQKGLGVEAPIPFTPTVAVGSGTAFTFTPQKVGQAAADVAKDVDKGASVAEVEQQAADFATLTPTPDAVDLKQDTQPELGPDAPGTIPHPPAV